jgi:undecaprenyl-diphosphatase
VIKDISSGEINSISSDITPMIIGFFAAFVGGLLACKWMIALVKKSKLIYFSMYCAIAGTIAIIYAF